LTAPAAPSPPSGPPEGPAWPDAQTLHLKPGVLHLPAPPPLSLYVHLPWCLRKCPYCDFNSHAPREGEPLPEARYLQALVADLESALPMVWGRRVGTVFIGGGTPSLFSPQGIGQLLADIRARLPLEPGCEITLEANPGTFEVNRFAAFREAGVTRLSLGVQSFDDAALGRIGRVHDAAQARAAAREAAQCFETFNLDLMYALPGQTLEGLKADVEHALACEPPHLSIYHLTLEPNTLFASRPPALPDEDTAAQMLEWLETRLPAAGLRRYEVSAFAREGHRCRHNLNYWTFGDYLGIGAGAHGKLSFAQRIVRQVRFRDPARYMAQALAGQPVAQQDEVARDALPFEFMLNALRLREGFDFELLAQRTGLPPSAVQAALDRASQRGLVDLTQDAIGRITRVTPTARGFDFLSDLQALFLPEPVKPGL
jgi:oxygen-independent coproporphyrinogen-3 oxidase